MAANPAAIQTPAGALQGTTLQSGWTLGELLARQPGGTGSNFGACYLAERGDERAFVKAIDFVKAINADDPFAELQKLTSIALFEREAMELCGGHKLSRLVQLISSEYVNLDPNNNPMNRVLCLIMEVGEGDLRKQISTLGSLSPSVIFGILSDVALGMGQLHRHGIAHQDVKPSNVISMTDMRRTTDNLFKVADLGRVVRRDRKGANVKSGV